MNALAPVAPRLAKLLAMLSSSEAGEVVNAARAIMRTLANLDIHALTAVVENSTAKRFSEADAAEIYLRGLQDGRAEAQNNHNAFHDPEWMTVVEECAASYQLTSKERGFVEDMLGWIRDGSEPTEKQAAWLRSIHRRVGR